MSNQGEFPPDKSPDEPELSNGSVPPFTLSERRQVSGYSDSTNILAGSFTVRALAFDFGFMVMRAARTE